MSVFASQGETGTDGSPSSLYGIVSTQVAQVWISSSNSLLAPTVIKALIFEIPLCGWCFACMCVFASLGCLVATEAGRGH